VGIGRFDPTRSAKATKLRNERFQLTGMIRYPHYLKLEGFEGPTFNVVRAYGHGTFRRTTASAALLDPDGEVSIVSGNGKLLRTRIILSVEPQ